MNRRHFVSAAAGTLAAPFVIAQSKTSPEFHGAILGQGDFRYRVDKRWSQADKSKTPVKDCHEMVQTGDGRLFLLTNNPQNNVLIFDRQGAVQGW
jgi:hypothetical protein